MSDEADEIFAFDDADVAVNEPPVIDDDDDVMFTVGKIYQLPRGGVTKAMWLAVKAELERILGCDQYEFKLDDSTLGGIVFRRIDGGWPYEGFRFCPRGAKCNVRARDLARMDDNDVVMQFLGGSQRARCGVYIHVLTSCRPGNWGVSEYAVTAMRSALVSQGLKVSPFRSYPWQPLH